MKIIKAECWKESVPLTRPYTIAYKVMDSVEIIYLRLETRSGLEGYGSASPAEYVTGESYEHCLSSLHNHLEELVTGKDLRTFKAIIRNAQATLDTGPAACAALDIALHDLFCKYLEIPLVQMFGQMHRSLPTSITIGIKSIEESVEEALEYKKRGFRNIKLKVGKELQADIEMTRKIKETVGKEMLIRVDANQGYDLEEYKTYIVETKACSLEFVEQPLPVDQTQDLLLVDTKLRKFAAGDESIQKPVDALKYAGKEQPFGIYNIKLMKCGGVDAARQIANIANLADIDLMWGCMDESCISIAAALHTALSSPNTKYLDLDGSFDLAKDLFKDGFVLNEGMMSVNDLPGLGVSEVGSRES